MITDTTYQEHDVFGALKGKVVVTEAGTYQHYNAGGQLHRVGGPAVEYANGSKAWWYNGLLHRTDGPAIDFTKGGQCWYLHGRMYTRAEHNRITRATSETHTTA